MDWLNLWGLWNWTTNRDKRGRTNHPEQPRPPAVVGRGLVVRSARSRLTNFCNIAARSVGHVVRRGAVCCAVWLCLQGREKVAQTKRPPRRRCWRACRGRCCRITAAPHLQETPRGWIWFYWSRSFTITISCRVAPLTFSFNAVAMPLRPNVSSTPLTMLVCPVLWLTLQIYNDYF